MKIAIFQGAGKPAKVDENLDIMHRKALSAAEQNADLIIFPELFLSGYNIGKTVQILAEQANGSACQKAAQIARETNIGILYGYPERLNGDVYNSALLIDRNGNPRANYRKTHLFGSYEKRFFKPGNALVIAELEGLNIGILICYDVEFPEAVRSLADAGAHLIAVPTALMKPYCRIAETVVAARAYESQVFVAYVNRTGLENKMTFCGHSSIVGPDGYPVLTGGCDEEKIFLADVEASVVKTVRKENPVLEDRRPELYSAPIQTI
ncbi:MAG: carbon-nitrogen hydrolase family protein [Desulfobacterales bacterium]|jgi:predicted amidohydrolase